MEVRLQPSYVLVTITWKRWPTRGFREALGGFQVSCVELGMRVFSKWRVVKVSMSNSATGVFSEIFAEDDVEIKDTGQQN